MIVLLGWLGTGIVLGTYAWAAKANDIRPFNYGNVIGSILLFICNVSLGTPMPTIVLGVAFGLIGMYGIVKGKH